MQLGGGATWLWHVLWVHQVHLTVKIKTKKFKGPLTIFHLFFQLGLYGM